MITFKWNPPETAPKNNTILLDVGFPWPVVSHWNPSLEEWVYCNLQVDVNDDTYFENEWTKEIEGWAPMPKIEKPIAEKSSGVGFSSKRKKNLKNPHEKPPLK